MKPRARITDPSQVPDGMTEDQARDFWDDHEITDSYLSKAGPVAEGALPKLRPRSKLSTMRPSRDVFPGLKVLVSIDQDASWLPWKSEHRDKDRPRYFKYQVQDSLLLVSSHSGEGREIIRRRPPSTTTEELLINLQEAGRGK